MPNSRLDSKEAAIIDYISLTNNGVVPFKDFCVLYQQMLNFYPTDIVISLLDIDGQDNVTGWTERTCEEVCEKLREYSSKGFTRKNGD